MGDVVLFVDDLTSYSSISICRICHEEEFESCRSLEAPCACSGTVKFAHRDCIQRWCNEKGNTVCELCLQKFEPGYTAPPKKIPLLDTTVTIRGSVEVPRRRPEQENAQVVAIAETQMHETENPECSSAADRSATCCRTVALLFSVLLLMRHLLAVVAGRREDYPFALFTVLIIKTCGILLPMYILLRMITAVQSSIRHHHQNQGSDDQMSDSDEDDDYED